MLWAGMPQDISKHLASCAGASEEAVRLADQAVTVPMSPSFVESFNVSGTGQAAACCLLCFKCVCIV